VSDALPDIIGSWLHSYEEDTASTSLYRPHDYPFRPSRRVRGGLEFRPDGSFIERQPGPDDRLHESVGRWKDQGSNRVRIAFPQGHRTPFELDIISCANGVLTIAKKS
jgi:hypothetical protein